MAILFHCF